MIMVSIVMITYGHEKYIHKAIESILDQECNFDFELIVSNDASPDTTDVIIKDLLATHPRAGKVKYTLHEKNIGMMANSLYSLRLAKGKYVASCEGDDYWTDKNKLQIQVDFLENNLDYVMCFHKVEVTSAEGMDNYIYPLPSVDTLYLKHIIKYHYIPTCSLMFRNYILDNGYPEWLLKSISGDIPLEILMAAKGKTKYINKEMACYRINPGGISQSPNQVKKIRSGYIFMYRMLLKELGVIKGHYLIYKLARLILASIKNSLLETFNLTQKK
jgi:glycosyltransferase involved in cell wall biosynthesis